MPPTGREFSVGVPPNIGVMDTHESHRQQSLSRPVSDVQNAAANIGLDDESAASEQRWAELEVTLLRVAAGQFRVPIEDARHLVHDVIVSYLTNPGVVRSNVRAFLIASVGNASRNHWRRVKIERRIFDDPPEVDTKSDRRCDVRDRKTDDLFEGIARSLLVGTVLAKLSKRCRDTLRRYYLLGESSTALADDMQTSNGNVHYILHQCRKGARRAYESLRRTRV
jgi:RNA polymerase sigma factor (sigma-70 family)